MQLAFDTQGGVTIVRVQEAKLTYPLLSSFFSEVQQRVDGLIERKVFGVENRRKLLGLDEVFDTPKLWAVMFHQDQSIRG